MPLEFQRTHKWPQISGPARTSEKTGLAFNPRFEAHWSYGDHVHSKRWIVDRATLKQARADDLHYVDDPQYLDLLNIFFANGESFSIINTSRLQALNDTSDIKIGQEVAIAPEGDCYCHGLLSSVLSQEFVLRDRPVHRHSSVLLCCCKGRRVTRTYQECSRGSTIIIRS